MKEVVNITFDLILRNPNDAVIIFDEPEVHLHPELVQKLVQTLATIGERNQFIFCTHSPHIISNSIEDTVICITYPESPGANQAKVVGSSDETQVVLKTLGQSIGVITLGNKIVFIEGEDASLDKDVYQKLIKEKYPKIVLVPSGGKSNLINFGSVIDNLLNKSIWGVDFFILSDQDASPTGSLQNETLKAEGNFRCLNKYHLENYFLDSSIIKMVFDEMEPDDSWLRDEAKIEGKLKELAASLISYAASLRVANRLRYDVGNATLMPKDAHSYNRDTLIQAIHDKANEEQKRIYDSLSPEKVEAITGKEYDLIKSMLDNNGDWKATVPGKILLKKFCTVANIEYAKFKRLYLAKAMKADRNPFQEILDIFEQFSKA